MPWVTPHAPARIDLDTCVTCGLCLPVCPTFRLTGDETASPRGRLAAISAIDTGVVDVDGRFDAITSFCLQCRACETACPSMVPYGEIIERARAEVATQIPSSVSRVRRIAVGWGLRRHLLLRVVTFVVALLQRLDMVRWVPTLGTQTRGLRRVPFAAGTVRGGSWGDPEHPEVVLFAGCVADAWFGGIHRSAVDVLTAAGYRVVAPDGQTCCGALAAHGGLADDAGRMADINAAALSGRAPIVVDVAGCGAHLKGYGRYGHDGIAVRTRDITELVADAIDEGRLPVLAPNAQAVAVVDPCHLEHGQRITAQPRRILEAAGYAIQDADPGGSCCGAAGIYQLDHPETGGVLGDRKAESVRATGASVVAVANAGCEMQLRRFLGSGYRVRHPIELYAEAIAGQDVRRS